MTAVGRYAQSTYAKPFVVTEKAWKEAAWACSGSGTNNNKAELIGSPREQEAAGSSVNSTLLWDAYFAPVSFHLQFIFFGAQGLGSEFHDTHNTVFRFMQWF